MIIAYVRGKSEEQYEITLSAGEMRCSCRAFEMGIGGPGGCKHLRRVATNPDGEDVTVTSAGQRYVQEMTG